MYENIFDDIGKVVDVDEYVDFIKVGIGNGSIYITGYKKELLVIDLMQLFRFV